MNLVFDHMIVETISFSNYAYIMYAITVNLRKFQFL